MTAEALLRRRPDPSEQEIRQELAGNLCRCTGYEGIVSAVRAAAGELGTADEPGTAGEPSQSTLGVDGVQAVGYIPANDCTARS